MWKRGKTSKLILAFIYTILFLFQFIDWNVKLSGVYSFKITIWTITGSQICQNQTLYNSKICMKALYQIPMSDIHSYLSLTFCIHYSITVFLLINAPGALTFSKRGALIREKKFQVGFVKQTIEFYKALYQIPMSDIHSYLSFVMQAPVYCEQICWSPWVLHLFQRNFHVRK
jgi:hypothetical protein